MSRIIGLSFLFLLFLKSDLHAQKTDSIRPHYDWALRINPLGLIDVFDHHLNVGVEKVLNSYWSVALEASGYFASQYYADARRTSGYMVKPSIRFYADKEKFFFLEVEPFYKQVNYRMEDWLGKESVEGIPSYFEFTEFVLQKKVVGGHLKAGIQTNLTRDRNWWIEFTLGAGIRSKKRGIKGDPRAVFNNSGFFFNDPDGDSSPLPSPSFGVRLVRSFR